MTGYEENNKEHPFKIINVRQYIVGKNTRIFETIKKALMLQSHNIHELTVLVSSDKINEVKENENK